MKRNTRIYTLISVITLLLPIISCEKRDFILMAKVKTIAITQIMATTANAEYDIVDIGESITDYGHY
jgi:hypothetical protein